MMPELGKYADTIMSAYAATIILMGVLIVLSVVRARKVKKQLAELEVIRHRPCRDKFNTGFHITGHRQQIII